MPFCRGKIKGIPPNLTEVYVRPTRHCLGGFILLEQLRFLVEDVNERGHLVPLLTGNQLSIAISADEEKALLYIDNGELKMSKWLDGEYDVYLSSSKLVMALLFSGKIKLRNASRTNELELHSTLRAALLLESVFVLANPSILIEETEISK